jgi:hypothetical protein
MNNSLKISLITALSMSIVGSSLHAGIVEMYVADQFRVAKEKTAKLYASAQEKSVSAYNSLKAASASVAQTSVQAAKNTYGFAKKSIPAVASLGWEAGKIFAGLLGLLYCYRDVQFENGFCFNILTPLVFYASCKFANEGFEGLKQNPIWSALKKSNKVENNERELEEYVSFKSDVNIE